MPDVKVEKSTESRTAPTGRERGGALTPSHGFLRSHNLFANDPFTMMRRMTEEMERALSTSFGLMPSMSRLGFSETGVWSPQIEVYERGNELVVSADLPGMKKDEVKVQLTEDALTIEGERRHEHEERHGGQCRSERSYGRFYRSIPVPEGTDPEKIQAQFKDGVLEVRLPLPESDRSRTREIPIRA
jgi:HSP20 family protein